MTEHWLYSACLPAGPCDFSLDGPEARHARVRRLRRGESVRLFDGRGGLAAAVVLETARPVLRVRVQSLQVQPMQLPRVTLAVGPPKGERLDWMLEKLTELGVARIVPAWCERTVARSRPERLDRWGRRLIEAAKQAHVAWLPDLWPAQGLADLLEGTPDYSHFLVADITPEAVPILEAAPRDPHDRPLLLIGPEGGFTPEERDRIARAAGRPVDLGPTVLRTETAAIVAVACLLCAAGGRQAGQAPRAERIP